MQISGQTQQALQRLDSNKNGVSQAELQGIQQDDDPEISLQESTAAGFAPQDLNILNQRLSAELEPNEILFELGEIQELDPLAEDWQSGKTDMLYSQNLGYLDRNHTEFYFRQYQAVFAAAQESLRTGQPQELDIQAGGNLTGTTMTYEVQAAPNSTAEDLHHLTRSLVASASYRYEAQTVLAGGVGNWVGEKVGMGQSAFSTEDLSSNALGIWAAERMIRANDNQAFATGPERNQALAEALATITEAGGDLSRDNPDLPIRSFGNDSFMPVRSDESTAASPLAQEALSYLQHLDESAQNGYHKDLCLPADCNRFAHKERYYPETGDGWQLVEVERSTIETINDWLNPFD